MSWFQFIISEVVYFFQCTFLLLCLNIQYSFLINYTSAVRILFIILYLNYVVYITINIVIKHVIYVTSIFFYDKMYLCILKMSKLYLKKCQNCIYRWNLHGLFFILDTIILYIISHLFINTLILGSLHLLKGFFMYCYTIIYAVLRVLYLQCTRKYYILLYFADFKYG